MQKLQGLLFGAVVGACYATAWFWASMAVDAFRTRRWAALGGLSVAGGLTLWLTTQSGAGAVLPIPDPSWGALRLLLFLPLALAASAAYYFLVLRPQETWQGLKARREDGRQIALHLVLLTGCLFFSLPYVWMVLTSLKPDDQIFKDPTRIPNPFVWKNYPRTFEFLELALGHIRTGYGSLFVLNTLQVTFLSLAAMVFSSSLVAYSFARLRWPGRDVLFAVLLGTMMLPGAVTMIPRFLIFKELGWVDTLLPLWIPSLFANAFDVFLLRQFFLTIPTDLEDAARIDGCNPFTIYWRILMPLIRPALTAVAIMHFLGTWNDFMGPLIYISTPEKMTGSYALRLFQSAGSGEWALLLAAATLWTLPVVLLFFFAQRAFIEGIALTGMKN